MMMELDERNLSERYPKMNQNILLQLIVKFAPYSSNYGLVAKGSSTQCSELIPCRFLAKVMQVWRGSRRFCIGHYFGRISALFTDVQ